MKNKINAILFDLDGTLLNTAPDIGKALSYTLEKYNLPKPEYSMETYHLFCGSDLLLAKYAQISANNPQYKILKKCFLNYYEQNIAINTHLYDHIDLTLKHLQQHNIPWGIVTNKPKYLTEKLLLKFPQLAQSAVTVSGDTLKECKPNPAPLLHACDKINISPETCYYIGDTETDYLAAKNAKMKSIIMMYGYRRKDDHPKEWGSQHYLENSKQLYDWLVKNIT